MWRKSFEPDALLPEACPAWAVSFDKITVTQMQACALSLARIMRALIAGMNRWLRACDCAVQLASHVAGAGGEVSRVPAAG